MWDLAAAFRNICRTGWWREFAELLPTPPASEFDNVEAFETIHKAIWTGEMSLGVEHPSACGMPPCRLSHGSLS